MVRLAARGLGIGLAIHTMVMFAGVFSEGWKARKAEEIFGARPAREAAGSSRVSRARVTDVRARL